MSTLLLLLLGCAQTGGPPPPAPIAAPRDQVAQVQMGLETARSAWLAGQNQAAADQVRRVYAEDFAALQPSLRAADPQATLGLEYAFGLLVSHAESPGPGSTVAAEIATLEGRLSAVASSLPAEPVVPAAPGEPTAPGVPAGQAPGAAPGSAPAGSSDIRAVPAVPVGGDQ